MKNTVKCCYNKCPCENHEIIIDSKSIRETVRYDKRYYHSDCFIKMLKRKRNFSESEFNKIINDIDSYKQDAYNRLIVRLTKDELNDFLINNYGVKEVSSYMWIKLNGIFDGEYSRTHGRIIPPEHLLDMWKRMIHNFKKNQQRLIVKGKKLNPKQQMSYDLEYLISKYDSYLRWLKTQETIESESEINGGHNTEFLTINIKSSAENNKVDDKIQDITDDIFDD